MAAIKINDPVGVLYRIPPPANVQADMLLYNGQWYRVHNGVFKGAVYQNQGGAKVFSNVIKKGLGKLYQVYIAHYNFVKGTFIVSNKPPTHFGNIEYVKKVPNLKKVQNIKQCNTNYPNLSGNVISSNTPIGVTFWDSSDNNKYKVKNGVFLYWETQTKSSIRYCNFKNGIAPNTAIIVYYHFLPYPPAKVGGKVYLHLAKRTISQINHVYINQ